MNQSSITETLTRLRDEVDVPAVNREAFRSRVRHERRATRVRGAVAVVACAAAATSLATILIGPIRNVVAPPPQTSDVASGAGAIPDPTIVPVRAEGRLRILETGGGDHAKSKAEEVLGFVGANVLYVSPDSRLRFETTAPVGDPGIPRGTVRGSVRGAALSLDGLTLAFLDHEGKVHIRDAGSNRDLDTSEVPASARVLAVDGVGFDSLRESWRWVEVDGPSLQVHSSDGSDVSLTISDILSAQLADDVLVITTLRGIEIRDPRSGELLRQSTDWSTSALAPSGERLLVAPSASERERGERGMRVEDTRTGTPIQFPSDDDVVVDLDWVDDDHFLRVTEHDGTRLVAECSIASQSCVDRYADASGTVTLPGPFDGLER